MILYELWRREPFSQEWTIVQSFCTREKATSTMNNLIVNYNLYPCDFTIREVEI